MYNPLLRIIDELNELSDDEFNSTTIVEPEFRISCNELIKSSYSTIDYQIDAFLIKIQEKYITNPVLVRHQLQKIFVKQLKQSNIDLYDDIITVIESFLPTAPNMDDIHFVQTNYYLNKRIDGSDILRTSKSKKEKYFSWNRDNLLNYYNNYDSNNSINDLDDNKSKIVINYDEENHLTYDFGTFCQINAILIKTNSYGLGKHMIKIKIPNIYRNHKENMHKYNDNDNDHDHNMNVNVNHDWLTHSILSIASYDGWLGFVDLNILSQLIRLEFDANGAVINELLFV